MLRIACLLVVVFAACAPPAQPAPDAGGWYDCPAHAGIDAPREGLHYATDLRAEVELLDGGDEFFGVDVILVDDTGTAYTPVSSSPSTMTDFGGELFVSMYQLAPGHRYELTAMPPTDQVLCGQVVTFFTSP